MTDAEKEFLLSLFNFDNKLSDNLKIKKLYTLSNQTEKYYKKYEIKKKSGKIRKVYEPNYYLKNIQKNILKNVLYDIRPSEYSNAYCPNKSIKDNAAFHVNHKVILKLDIKNFFDNIDYSNVYKVYSSLGFSKRICSLLTYLCTYNEFLPQGAPTSSYLSNIVLRHFDYVVGEWCEERNISYSRYSDDMTFSMEKYDPKIIGFVRSNLYKVGLELNNDKICVVKNSNKQKITGVVVNEKLQADIKYRKRIRQEIYYIKKFGLDSHLKKINYNLGSKKYLLSLLGKINFVNGINSTSEFLEYKEYVLKSLTMIS